MSEAATFHLIRKFVGEAAERSLSTHIKLIDTSVFGAVSIILSSLNGVRFHHFNKFPIVDFKGEQNQEQFLRVIMRTIENNSPFQNEIFKKRLPRFKSNQKKH